MQFHILSTFPEYFASPLKSSIIGRAVAQKIICFNLLNLRDFTQDKHRTTDDRPFGGGAGMVMKIEPIDSALESINIPENQTNLRILFSARGKRFTQLEATRLAKYQSITMICGHYGDVDQRVADNLIDEEISVGDYVLTGGEPAALIVIDAVTRLLPGALGNELSTNEESHSFPGKLSPPSYTRPAEYRGWKVPGEMLSGNPKLIEQWKNQYLVKNQALPVKPEKNTVISKPTK